MKYFRDLEEGRKIIIKTHQKPLTYALGQKWEKASPRQLRQLSFISQFITKFVMSQVSRIANINMLDSITIGETAAAQRVYEDLLKVLEFK